MQDVTKRQFLLSVFNIFKNKNNYFYIIRITQVTINYTLKTF